MHAISHQVYHNIIIFSSCVSTSQYVRDGLENKMFD